ncbi:hypothetical protein FH972_026068 [Carpinus fangiana]|uniref:DNA repair protein RAD14 n=1 Tax=Carpinus fangiana TaxID=176857 RepID=A0A5N6L2V3_9ROSI|nr:hypothetical protein FH972_026068 [Carpinus fangiana]
MADRPSTPPARLPPSSAAAAHKSPLTPEQVRRMEESRLKAKALRAQKEATAPSSTGPAAQPARTPSGFIAAAPPLAGQKRPASTLRDARQPEQGGPKRPHDEIQAARKFTKYVDYDFSQMTDTKGGFLAAEDDRFNRALHGAEQAAAEQKPAHMTAQEWERHRLLKKLRETRQGPFEPGLSSLQGRLGYDGETEARHACEGCGGLEIDWKWVEVFGRRICGVCKDRFPDKYSLLTKTEAKEDYLLTEPEMKDEELLPHLEKPNPHKATWHNMFLYLRCQVEEYAFSAKKWGSPEALDAEFEKREKDKKKRKEDKFRQKLQELKKRTRVDAYKRAREGQGIHGGGDKAEFGERVRARNERHEHEWGRAVERPDGTSVKSCVECGMEVEELEF